ncbi:MAG TPA: hypothetical protein VJN44_00455, partial [Roseateles sp.]|nr:hypothetical protein [Roseateles sp.]
MSDGSSDHTPPCLALQYFDGRQARAQAATVWCDAEQLHLQVDGRQLSYPRRSVLWPERQRHGRRQAQLPDGGVLEAPDAAAWDDWARASGLRDPQAARWAQSWRHAGAAMLLLCALL